MQRVGGEGAGSGRRLAGDHVPFQLLRVAPRLLQLRLQDPLVRLVLGFPVGVGVHVAVLRRGGPRRGEVPLRRGGGGWGAWM